MLRYLRRLADKDVALDRSMIPLGSCTMKLNATAEMEPITWPGFRQHPSVRPARPGGGLPRAHPRSRAVAVRDHRLRRGVAATQRRLAGRARRSARHPRVAPQPRRHRARRLPHPVVGARHERRVSGDGQHARRRGRVRRRRQRRPRRPPREAGRARRRRRRADGHLPVDARRVRGVDRRRLRGGARRRRPGLRRRRQPQRARRARPAGPVRRRRQPPEPAQDVLHPPRRRRSRRRAGRGALPPRAVPAEPPARARGRRPVPARSRPPRGARPASCRSRGRTSA